MICTGWGGGLSACSTVVGDPGFHRGGCQTPRRGPNPLFGIIFAENYMKMKKIGLRQSEEKGWVSPPKIGNNRFVSSDCSRGWGAADIKV